MVILDTFSTSKAASEMLAAASATSTGQYINPDDILSPLSSAAEMDSKASPLAMLAKTCSQIGADPIVGGGSVTNKTGSTIMKKRSSPDQLARQRNSPLAGSISDPKSCILDGSTDPNTRSSPIRSKSRSRSSSTEIRVTDNMTVNSSSTCNKKTTSPLLKSVSGGVANVPTPISTAASAAPSSRPLPPSVSYPAHSTSSNTSAAALLNNPFLASFASSLQQSPESGSGLTGGGGCMSSNAAAAAAAAAASSVCRDPMCRDPLCPTALRNQQHLNSFTYSSLLASPYYKEAMMAFTLQQRMAALAAGTPPGSAAGALPHVCNWVAGTEYCGRRFANAEELLVHVKTHTNLSTSDPRALSILNAASSAPPTSHQRFHPYARPSVAVGATPPTVPPSVTAPMPPALAALASNPYASLYTSLFSRPPLL